MPRGICLSDPDELEFTEEHGRLLATLDRNNRLVYGSLTYFMLERAWALMGMDSFLKSFFTHPREMKNLLHKIADYDIRVFERYLEIGADGVTFSEDLGHQRGLMISPKFFRDFFVPEYRRCFEHACTRRCLSPKRTLRLYGLRLDTTVDTLERT